MTGLRNSPKNFSIFPGDATSLRLFILRPRSFPVSPFHRHSKNFTSTAVTVSGTGEGSLVHIGCHKLGGAAGSAVGGDKRYVKDYIRAVTTSNLTLYFKNSLIVLLVTITALVLFSSTAAFSIEKMRFAANKWPYDYSFASEWWKAASRMNTASMLSSAIKTAIALP